jgi:hypothetical protein
LAAYVLGAGALSWLSPRLIRLRWALNLPEPGHAWPETLFLAAQGGVAALVCGLSAWLVLSSGAAAERWAAVLDLALLIPAGVLLTGAVSERWGEGLRYLTLGLGVAAVTESGWALLGANGPAPWMHRAVVLMASLALAAAAYGSGLARVLPGKDAWVRCGRRTAPFLGALAVAVLLSVLGQEFLSYDFAARRTPLAPWAVAAVAVCLGSLIAGGIGASVAPGRDPLGLSDRGRTWYVYAGEVLLVLFFIHLRLNVPELFPKISGRYWPLIAMAVAYLGAGSSVLLQRKGLSVLAVPLQNTGALLPLLPLLEAVIDLMSAESSS